MIRHLFILSILTICSSVLHAQCECTDCPINIPNNSTESSFLDISGASNNTLGSNGQELCMVCINLVYDAIEELDMVLISPSGDEVDLILNTGIGVNDNISFEICFVSCNVSANPDPGFPDIFNANAGYLPNESYDGSYYPADGCFEDFSGAVNGSWELEMTDNVFADNGDLFDWYLVFTDDSGIACANAGACSNSISCVAEGGELGGPSLIEACEGDPSLNLSIPVSWPGGNEPPAPDYEYTFVIVNEDSDVVEDITMTTDLTSYSPGTYELCGLSYLSSDSGELPNPDGSLEYDDIENQIDNGDYCADLSNNCITVVVDPVLDPPEIDGPLSACVDESIEYEILNYDENIIYNINLVSGSLSEFVVDEEIINITWTAGPGEFCVLIESLCGDQSACIVTEVLPNSPELELTGNLQVCPESTHSYTVTPAPPSGVTYQYSVTGGIIVSQDNAGLEVQWQADEGEGEICIEPIGALCDSEILCETIIIEFDYSLPQNISVDDELCEDEIRNASIPDDGSILNYNWSVSSELSVLQGQGSNTLEFSADQNGLAEICLEIETSCGIQGPLCEEILIFPNPQPDIADPEAGCGLEFNLEALTDPENDVNWDYLSGPGDVEFLPEDEITTTAIFSSPGLYEIVLTESNVACSDTRVIELEVDEGLEINNLNIECNLDAEYTVSFDVSGGASPYSVNGDGLNSDSFISDPMATGETYIFEIEDANGCTLILEDDNTCPCFTDAGTMSEDTLRVCIEDNLKVQAEWLDNGSLDNNDLGLYYLHDSPDDELGTVFDINDTGSFEYFDALTPGETYYISFVAGNPLDNNSIDITDACLSVSEGQPVQFIATPEVNLTLTIDTCSLAALINGTASESSLVSFLQISGPETAEIIFNGDFPVNLSVNTPGEYSFEYLLSNGTCSLSDTIDVDFPSTPSIRLIEEDCGGGSDFYVIRAIVSGGQAPYESSIAGSFTDSLFISDNIPTGSEYSLAITDANGCISDEVQGRKLCDCISVSGLLPADTLSRCGVIDSIQIAMPPGTIRDTNDISMYYLHSSEDINSGERIDSSLSGQFGFNSIRMVLDSVYFVSILTGNGLNQGIDFDDPCLDISNSQPVVWYRFPDANAGTDSIICDLQFFMNADPRNGSWEILSQPTGSNLNISDVSDPEARLDLTGTGDFVFSWNTERNGCSSSDTLVIAREERPMINTINTECNDDLSTYNLTLQWDNGEEYMINQQSYLGLYSVDNIPADSVFAIAIENVFGCVETLSFNAIDCSCPSEAGSLAENSQILCAGDSPILDVFNQDFVLDGGDSLVYILHDGDANTIGNILQLSSDEIIYNNDIMDGRGYYINQVISPFENNVLDLSDPCTQVSEGLYVEWLSENTVTLPATVEACIDESFVLEFNVDSRPPVEILLINNLGDSLPVILNDNTVLLNYQTSAQLDFIDVELISGQCTSLSGSRIAVEKYAPSAPIFVEEPSVCNNAVFGSVLFLDSLFESEVVDGEWNTGSLPSDINSIDLDGVPAGSYLLEFSTVGYEDPCPGNGYTINLTVTDCICPELDFEDLKLCRTDDTYELGQLNTQNFTGRWSLAPLDNQQAQPEIVNNESIASLSNADPGKYAIRYSIDDNLFPEPCAMTFEFILFLFQENNAGMQAEFPVFCSSDASTLNLFSLLENADPDGTWLKEDNVLGTDQVQSQALDTGENIFQYIVDSGSECVADTSQISIEVYPVPEFTLQSEDVICFGDNDGLIVIEPKDDTGDDILCYVNDVLQQGSKTIDNLSPGAYTVYIENEFCRSALQTVIIDEPEAVSVTLGDDKTVNFEEELILRAITNILESDVGSISWSDLSGILETDVFELKEFFNNDNTITVELTDSNGCIAIDQIRINVIQPELYIPNIFNASSFDNNNFGIMNPEAVEYIYSFSIFDRWGNKVVDREDIDAFSESARWDGYYNNTQAQAGVYVFVFDLLLKNGNREVISGDITLIW